MTIVALLFGLLTVVAVATASLPKRSHSAGSPSSIQNLKDHIKNVVILEMENRSVDNLLGGQTIAGLANPINNGPFCNPYNLTDASQGTVCSAANDYDSIMDDPDHSVTGNNIEFYETYTPNNDAIAAGTLTPTQRGFVHEQLSCYGDDANRTKLAKQVLNYYTEEEVPVMTSLVQNFLTFNHWHSDIPGPTNPNRVYVLSGTSAGRGNNGDGFGLYEFGQRSIFQQLSETGHSWKNYYTIGGMVDAGFFQWTYNSGNVDKAQPMLYRPVLLRQRHQFDPSGLISDGEAFIKDVYNALRASPQWNETLFILTFDETGGFHDHVPPPLATRPDELTYTETAPNGNNYTFSFNRLGGRVPTLLISPWIGKGVVEQNGTNSKGETLSYSASSILRTLGYLWDFAPFTPRVETSASFDHLIQTVQRSDTPEHLPQPEPFKLEV